jgi:hypothetical protein
VPAPVVRVAPDKYFNSHNRERRAAFGGIARAARMSGTGPPLPTHGLRRRVRRFESCRGRPLADQPRGLLTWEDPLRESAWTVSLSLAVTHRLAVFARDLREKRRASPRSVRSSAGVAGSDRLTGVPTPASSHTRPARTRGSAAVGWKRVTQTTMMNERYEYQ